MKRFGTAVFILFVASILAAAQDTSVNVNSYTIPELPSVPVVDGDLSDAVWASVPAIPMDMLGDSPPADPGTGDLDIVLKVAWDDETNALYFGVNVKDESYVGVRGLGSSVGTDGYNGERLEVILDGTNSGDAASSTTSGYHQQYTFDMPYTWDTWSASNDIAKKVFTPGEMGYLDTTGGGIKPSATFVQVPVFERIEGTLNLTNDSAPWDIANEYVESAARIRVTDPQVTEWAAAPVEFSWEVKIIPFEYIMPAADLGYDITDPAEIATGWLSFWKDPVHIPLDLKEKIVVGFTAQQNDADVWDETAAREHQTNTTGVAGNWNSSESLTGLILGAKSAAVPDWSLQ
ncbi:MAG: hypothetical protein ACE15F_00575 [bacterium]